MGDCHATFWIEEVEVARGHIQAHVAARCPRHPLLRDGHDSAPANIHGDMGLVAQPLAGHDLTLHRPIAQMQRIGADAERDFRRRRQPLPQGG